MVWHVAGKEEERWKGYVEDVRLGAKESVMERTNEKLKGWGVYIRSTWVLGEGLFFRGGWGAQRYIQSNIAHHMLRLLRMGSDIPYTNTFTDT